MSCHAIFTLQGGRAAPVMAFTMVRDLRIGVARRAREISQTCMFYGCFWFLMQKTRMKSGDLAVFPQAAVLR